ncbi:hypothetical protein ACFPPD_03685 [Cohnella suwonensis]|uniref:Uncharacterized protein n=1 Tax=Cohnella suwonensis TaxID=696072 RepID=A0ABW0LT98_9BACL
MNEDSKKNGANAWERYVQAKNAAFGPDADPEAALTIEELEAAIAEAAASSGIPETGMPPRSGIHTPSRLQLSKWFYLSLVVLFAALVVGLLWWGRREYGDQ